MELKEFIKNSLVDILNAVDEAKQQYDKRDIWISGTEDKSIEFDIAVSVLDTSSGNKDNEIAGKIQVMSVFAGSAKHKSDFEHSIQNQSISRIKFSVKAERFTNQEEQENIDKMNQSNIGTE